MKAMKKTAIGFILGAAAFGWAASASAAAPVDDASMQMINSMIMQMQQQTMVDLYQKMPPKDQMRGQKMQDFSSKLQLQSVIQPVMMQKNINILKAGFMQDILSRPIPVPGS
ncbi:hypothetical protein [Candidatus Electronema sp. JM]|uniref:hypothetical protein n=1 Tax=Candidatus Electronema sp. JM TaxID=3401571 RepID=UPI003AA81A70